MKTAEQFLEECKAEWKRTDPRMRGEDGAKEAMIKALTLYAEQAIDKCATFAKSTEDAEEIRRVKQLLT